VGGEKGAFLQVVSERFFVTTEAEARIGLNGSGDDGSPDDGSG
jgi:hypothetical protein